ncbi:hypothetical protein NL50_01225 [Clostridium acetobutylicum]|nr:hypothetical protein NL50_01225 [Clostridium acetobutylicum]
MEHFDDKSELKRNGFYFSYNVDKENIEHWISAILFQVLKDKEDIVILSLGVDTLVGDSLGPLVGSILKRNGIPNVYGTLDRTVNAYNIIRILDEIHEKFKNPYILVVDAAVTAENNANDIVLRNGGFTPGFGVYRQLPTVGDFSLVGVVNKEDEREHNLIELLKKCRFDEVLKLARIISKILVLTFVRMNKGDK